MKRETWKWALQLLISILTAIATTDSNRDHDGSDLVHGVKSEEWDCQKIWWSHYLFRISANSCAKVLEDWKKSSTFV